MFFERFFSSFLSNCINVYTCLLLQIQPYYIAHSQADTSILLNVYYTKMFMECYNRSVTIFKRFMKQCDFFTEYQVYILTTCIVTITYFTIRSVTFTISERFDVNRISGPMFFNKILCLKHDFIRMRVREFWVKKIARTLLFFML